MEKSVILNDSETLSADDIFLSATPQQKELIPDSFNLLDNEKVLIDKAIRHTGGNLSMAAKELGINRSTLYDKIKKYDL
jgi:transcriptional regulator of acetoin/glycerol metabolism